VAINKLKCLYLGNFLLEGHYPASVSLQAGTYSALLGQKSPILDLLKKKFSNNQIKAVKSL
jgi:hypothetical protein